MGKTVQNTLGILCLLLLSSSLYSQDTISVNSNNNGLVDYNLTLSDPKSHVFILYGDGTYGHNHHPLHQFPYSLTGYTTEAFIVKPYKPAKPPKKTTVTGATGFGGLYTNPIIFNPSEVNLFTSWAPADTFENYFIIAFQNLTSTVPVSGCIELHYDNMEVAPDFSRILVYNNWVSGETHSVSTMAAYSDKIKWDFANLAPYETRYVYVPMTVTKYRDDWLSLETVYNVNCITIDNAPTTIQKENQFYIRRYPHDPNFKRSTLSCMDINGQNQNLEYTVGFFNDGHGPSNHVFVDDFLPDELAPHSAILTWSEYPASSIVHGNQFEIDFIDIHLPGIQQTGYYEYSYEDCSSEFSFNVCTVPPLTWTSCIINEAEIQFDYEPIFIAGPDTLCVEIDCFGFDPCPYHPIDGEEPIEGAYQGFTLDLFPNPVVDHLNISIRFDKPSNIPYQIEILDYSGNVVQFVDEGLSAFEKIEKQFYLNELSKGIYLLVFKYGEERHLEKFIKI